MQKAEAAYRAYLPLAQETMRIAGQVQDTATIEQQDQLAKSSLASRSFYMAARMAFRDLTQLQQQRSTDGFNGAYAEAASQQNLLIGFVLASLIIGAGLGVLIGRFGIAAPIRQLTTCLMELANGRFDVAVPGADRRDEVGEIARAAETFKSNGIEAQQLRSEQEAAKARSEQEQKALMRRMADDFDRAVGGIVTHVSSAASQLKGAPRRSPAPPRKPRARPARWPPPPRRPRPMSRRSPRPPRSSPPRSARSAAASSSRP